MMPDINPRIVKAMITSRRVKPEAADRRERGLSAED
jgi:hypothetical protein